MPEPIQIYVNNTPGVGSDSLANPDGSPRTTAGNQADPVETADRAFGLLPPSWKGTAEIIFVPTMRPYRINTSAIYFGTPIGPEASSLVIRAASPYRRVRELSATAPSLGDDIVTADVITQDFLIGAMLGRLGSDGRISGTVVPIRGNTSSDAASENFTIRLQRPLSAVAAAERFAVERPSVILAPQQILTITSHDGRSPNLRLVGIAIEPAVGAGLVLINVRAECDTCEFHIRSAGAGARAVLLQVHSNSRIQGGIEGHPSRDQAGVYIRSNSNTNIIRAVRNGVLGGHLTFDNITVQISQGGWFVPRSLEANAAPIHLLTGGSALAERQTVAGAVVGWGTASNKARIRNVQTLDADRRPDGDGLRVINGGSINSPLGPINLDIYGCNRDGIRLDSGSSGFFGPPGGNAGLATTGEFNGEFGMNVRYGSRAFVGLDAFDDPRLIGRSGEIALDDDAVSGGWMVVARGRPALSNQRLSVVGINR